MNQGQKLKKAQIRALPEPVSRRVLALQDRYRTRNCTFFIEPVGWQMYLDEGASYTCWDGDQREFTLHMQSERTLHAGGHRMSHQIGQRYPVPQGAWVVEFELFLGKPIIDVHHVGPYSLPA